MKSVLVMTYSDPTRDPRPNRMIQLLREKHAVTVVGFGSGNFEGINFIPIQKTKSKHYQVGIKLVQLLLRKYTPLTQPEYLRNVATQLDSQNFDLIVLHDLSLFPLAVQLRKKAKILFDAREYYPKHFEDQLIWKIIYQPINKYLCDIYVKKADRIITVSEGIAKEYKDNFGVASDVVMSLPDPMDLVPSKVDPQKIRLIHHGIPTPSRRNELMIEMMDYIDKRFHLDLMFATSPDNRYFFKLQQEGKKRTNISFIPPVPYTEIIKFTNQYDIGVFLVPPTTLNLQYSLPNKLFEFIQARLAVAIGPSIEMKKIVEAYDCGIVSTDFRPKSLAEKLNGLTALQLETYKKHADCAAKTLNSRENAEKILSIIEGLL